MNPELEGVWKDMCNLGLGALTHANRHAAYLSIENDMWEELAVLQAAHAAEILIKARIAQEHPLLIFEKLPPMSENEMSINDLFEKGKTIDWSDLPSRLWATTGIVLPNLSIYKDFGKIRNGIQHLVPQRSNPQMASIKTLEFIYSVIDPFINDCWGLYAIDYDEDYEPYFYLTSSLINNGIYFLVSKEAADCVQDWNVDWTKTKHTYHEEMNRRIELAKSL